MGNVNFNSPFAQALVAEGRRRGYSNHAIASTLGNAQVESGLNSASRTGDNGTAFGGMQWRLDRHKNLVSAAQKAGVDYTDPKVQAGHWFDEQDGVVGSEKRYGDRLKAAQSVQDANNAVISSLRPQGWTEANPEGGHSYARRLALSQQALSLLEGGNPQADMPAEGAANAEGQASGIVVPGQDAQAAPQGMWEQFKAGGPGALLGMPQAGWNAGDALLGVGASLMARDNPTGASALAKQITQAKSALARQTVRVDSKSGQATVYDPNTGKFTTSQAFDRPAPERPEPNVKTREFFQKNTEVADIYSRMGDQFAEYRDLIADDQMDFSILKNAEKNLNQLWDGQLTPQQRNAVRFAIDMEKMRNDRLLEAKGVQTEGDAQRAMSAILPAFTGSFNRDAMLEAMDLGFKGAQRGYGEVIKKNDAAYRQHGDKLAYTGYDEQLKERTSKFDEAQNRFAPKLETYRKRRSEEAKPAGNAGVAGTQDRSNGGSLGLYDAHRQRTQR